MLERRGGTTRSSTLDDDDGGDSVQDLGHPQALLRASFHDSPVPQAHLDPEGRLAVVNPALERLLGSGAEQLRGSAAELLGHASDSGAFARELHRVLQGSASSGRAEHVVAGAGGTAVPTSATISAVRAPDGAVVAAVASWQDLSGLRDEQDRQQRMQEDFFAALSRNANDLALVVNETGTVLYVSTSVSHLFGYELPDVLASSGFDFLHPDDVALAEQVLKDVVSDGSTRTFTMRVRHADGSWRWIEETASNLLDTAVGGIVCNLRDITQRVEAERALRASEARYRAILDTSAEGMWAVSACGETLYVNARLAEICGVDQQLFYDLTAFELLDQAQVQALRHRLVDGAFRTLERFELTYRHPDGQDRVLSVAATPLEGPDGSVEGSLAMISDVTETRRAEAELRHAALHDALTGLPNRALLLDRLERGLAREQGATAVVFVDLDHFKVINDSRGHAIGDALLVAVAERLRDGARPTDTVARFGGDEFVVVWEDVDAAEAEAMAAALLASLRQPFALMGGTVHVDASVGVALSPPADAAELLRFADTAMYAAKAGGRGRVRSFDASLADEADERYALAADLRTALRAGGLALHYQPVVDVSSGAVVGMEALARWEHPDHGTVPPSRFVRVAETAGLIAELDAWVLRRAFRDLAGFRAAGAVPPGAHLAVNLSAHNIGDPSFTALLAAAAADAGVAPGDVVLEITEGAIMSDAEGAIGVLRDLRAQGFGIAIDDFGTGYSSLAYLRDLPLTVLKIDRSFISHIAVERDALAIVASIVDLARAVGVAVVAEGVETDEQAVLLRALGCAAGQGWLWSAAVPAAEVCGGAWRAPFPMADEERAVAPPRARRPSPAPDPRALQRILTLHQQGASLSTIAAALNREELLTPAGRRWHTATVARAIADATYPEFSAR